MEYMPSANLPARQSRFRTCHSTETAVLQVLSDILLAIDRGDLAALILLDLAAAFDTVDNDILLQRLQMSFCIQDVALQWFQSYLLGRSQYGAGMPGDYHRVYAWCATGISIRTNTVYHVHCRLGLGD